MSGLTDARVRELLKELEPRGVEPAPAAELWPAVRARVDRPARRVAPGDWLLLTALALLCLIEPSAIRMLLFHF